MNTTAPKVQTPAGETDARIAYIRYEYTRTLDTAEPDIAPENLDYLNDLNDEHVYATHQDIAPLTPAEMADWYAGAGARVREILGDYVTF